MSSNTYYSVDHCPHCGRKTLHTEQNDFSGHCDKTSQCKHCGYVAHIDAGCGPWEDSDIRANKKVGVIIAGFYDEEGNGHEIVTAPGSLEGAHRFMKVLAPERIAFLPAGENPLILCDEVLAEDDPEFHDEFQQHLAAAKAFYDRIVLTPFPLVRN